MSDMNTPALDIAIIGMAGRFPGAGDLDEFWQNLKGAVESISFFSAEELAEAGLDPETVTHPQYVKAKGILDDVEYFDAPFFDYTSAEAEIMDPQIRIFHQWCWRALEHAGYDPGTYEGSIGIYAGATNNFPWVQGSPLQLDTTAQQLAAEIVNSQYFATLIAYKLNLTGPAFTLQTACSTSLVAVHAACQALLSGECDMALAGGVSVTLPVAGGYLYQTGMINSPDGHCRAFDAGARGTVPGNGVGVVVLKRLEDAAADRDTIHALIKGSAVNNDGSRKVGYTAPSVEGQAEVICAALRMAAVDPLTISYIETHGTGTPLGDPVEIEGLKLALGGAGAAKGRSCGIGSLKTNVGHMDSAAGVGGLIKTVLALEHRLLPPSLHFKTPNPAAAIPGTPFYVVTEPREWRRDGAPLRAGVSAFGIGGTNAHVILEEAPEVPAQGGSSPPPHERPFKLILLSARSQSALDRAVQHLAAYLKEHPRIDFADVAYTLQVGRQAFNCRRMLLAAGVEEALESLASGGSGQAQAASLAAEAPSPVFMFPGQGAQYVDMARGLYLKEPVFREEMDRCFDMLAASGEVDIKGVLYPELSRPPGAGCPSPGQIERTEIAQPALFVVEYALAKLLMAWGFRPEAMIGHSIGEYTAACLAGVLSLEDALEVVCLRGRLMAQAPEGAMLGISLAEGELEPLLAQNPGIALAAVNSPHHCVVSGSTGAVERFARQVNKQGGAAETMRLHTSHAFHSPLVEPILEEFREKIAGISFRRPRIPYMSNLTGSWIRAEEAADPAYWGRHIRQTVRFSRGLAQLLADQNRLLVEVGPGNSLSKFAREHMAAAGERGDAQPVIVNTLRHPRQEADDSGFLLHQVGLLWLSGAKIDWPGFYRYEKRRRIPLPTYSFDRCRYWKYSPPGLGQKSAPERFHNAEVKRPAGPKSGGRDLLTAPYVPPGSALQQTIAAHWQELFGLTEVGIKDGFFELGGDSLKALGLTSRLHRELDIEIPLPEFFRIPTIEGLAAYIEKARRREYSPLRPVEKQEYYEVSSSQKRIYIIQQMDVNTISYNMAGIYEVVAGVIDKEQLEAAFRELIRRHESLRTCFELVHGRPVQRVHEPGEIHFEIRQQTVDSEVRGPGAVERFITAFARVFDLGKAPLMRVGLVEAGGGKQLLMVDLHHIVSDGFSDAVIIKDFLAFYNGTGLPPLKLHYKDFSQFQRRSLETEEMKRQARYWLDMFAADIPVLDLPFDYPRPAVKGFEGDMVYFDIGRSKTAALMALIEGTTVTLYMVLAAVFNLLLSKYSGLAEIVVGCPVAGRRVDLENIVGIFVNTLPIRSRLEGEKSFREFLEEVKESTLQAFDNQDYPFEKLVEEVVVSRDTSHSPLFDVLFEFLNIEPPMVSTPRLQLKKHPFNDRTSAFDLALVARQGDGELLFYIKYSTNVFKWQTIRRFIGYFKEIVSAVGQQPDQRLREIDMIPQEEKRQLLVTFNDTAAAFRDGRTLAQMIEDQAVGKPDAAAVVDTDGSRLITYAELNRRVNQLAQYLREECAAAPGTIVGILQDRSIDMIVTLLGVVKSGAGYLSMDPGYPRDRIGHMLTDSRARLVVVDQTGAELAKASQERRLVDINAERECLSHKSGENPLHLNRPSDILYVIYTSGSTGMPNGAMLSHGILTNLVKWQREHTPIDSSLRCLQFTSTSFCVSFQEIMITLTSGGELHLIGEIERQDIDYLMDFLCRRRIGLLYLPFSYLNFLFNESGRWGEQAAFRHSLKHIVTAGEQLKITAGLKRFLDLNPGLQLHNHYGSSEMHVVTAFTLDAAWAELGAIPPAGRPVANTRIYILDEHQQPAPIGAWGELCVAGSSEILGYINNRALTDQKLQHHALPVQENSRLYHSGDIGRWLQDGFIELKGRKDAQIKIRGFRVEPGEIESKLLMMRGVRDCVVVVSENQTGQKELLAYVVLDRVDLLTINKEIRNFLPQYMVPRFVVLERLPLMPNGKVDRDRLPTPAGETGRESPADIDVDKITALLNVNGGAPLPVNGPAMAFASGDAPLEEKIAYLTSRLRRHDHLPAGEVKISGITIDRLSPQPEEQYGEIHSPIPLCVQFEEQAVRTPEKTAVVGPYSSVKAEEVSLSYRQLNERANQLAHLLRAKGVGPGTVVAQVAAPSVEMVIGILAILKTGGAYVSIEPTTPGERVMAILEQVKPSWLLTNTNDVKVFYFTYLQDLQNADAPVRRTAVRPAIKEIETLPIPDRSLVNYEKYNRFIGITIVKNCISLYATRGCPFKCAYCHKLWPRTHVVRSARHIFSEIKTYYDMGVRRFSFIDDVFNLDARNSRQLFELIIKNGLDIQIYFPSGLRGDILTKDYIDLMIKAGTVHVGLALETASPRLQELIGKHLHLEKFRRNVEYLCKQYPHIILDLNTMVGFPTETVEEADMTLEFIESLKWIDFPYVHILKILPNTNMEQLAIRNGISREAINISANLAYHEIPTTLPFDRGFALGYQTRFLNEYFLSRERLLHVLPHQMAVLTEDDMVQKYNSYLPVDIRSFAELLGFVGITPGELGKEACLHEGAVAIPDFNRQLRAHFPAHQPDNEALQLLLLDLSQHFSADSDIVYTVVEPPLGLMSLLTYVNRQLGGRVNGRIAKARIDFDNYDELKALVEECRPDIVGIRTLSFYKDFFHKTVTMIRQWGFSGLVITGGPYATSDFRAILQDRNVDLVVLGEGEITFTELLSRIDENRGRVPGKAVLKEIPGLAFADGLRQGSREILLLDGLEEQLSAQGRANPEESSRPPDPAKVPKASHEDTGSLVASYLFDASPPQLFGPLNRGAALHILPQAVHLPQLNLLEFYRQESDGGPGTGEPALHIRLMLDGTPTAQKPGDFDSTDPVEAGLRAIWSELLETKGELFSPGDNFFEVGGHSLKATALIVKIHQAFDVKLDLVEIFRTPTLREMSDYIKAASREAYRPIEAAEEREYYPAAPAQKRLYILQQMERDSTFYNMPCALALEGQPDMARLQIAFRRLIRRHESLRTSFRLKDNRPVQQVHPAAALAAFKLEERIGDRPEMNRLIREFIRPFDLSRAPLLRVGVIRLLPGGRSSAEEQAVLLVDMHHIACDGVSVGIIIDDFLALYRSLEMDQDGEAALPRLNIRYRDYAEWQSRAARQGSLDRQRDFWLEQFGGPLPVLDLPTDYPRPDKRSYEGDRLTFTAAGETAASLRARCRQGEVTPYLFLLAVFNVLLSKYTEQEDIVVGTPAAGRSHDSLAPVVGMFVNTLALRSFPSFEKSFAAFLEEVKHHTLQAFKHQDYPFEDLVEQVAARRDPGRNPIFDVWFSLNKLDMAPVSIPGLRLTPIEIEGNAAKFDLSLDVFEEGRDGEGKLTFQLVYGKKIFKKETVRRLGRHFLNILEEVLADPSLKIAEIDMLRTREVKKRPEAVRPEEAAGFNF